VFSIIVNDGTFRKPHFTTALEVEKRSPMTLPGTFPLVYVMLTAALGFPAHAQTSPDHDFWSSFAAPDQDLDVEAALPDGLVMSYEEASGGVTTLSYDVGSDTFALVIDDMPITDLVSDLSDPSRPAFAGAINVQGEPGISGFVDLDEEGRFVIELTASASATRLLVSDVTHDVIAIGKCKCPALHSDYICNKNDCDVQTPPYCDLSDTKRCTWFTEEVTP